MTNPLTATLQRDMKLAWRDPARIMAVPAFFILVIAVFPLALGGDMDLLSRAAPGILLAALSLSALATLDRLFRDDAEDGTLDSILLLSAHPALYTLGRMIAHWAVTAAPFLILYPLLAAMLNFAAPVLPAMFLILLPASLALVLIGGAVQALGMGAGIGGNGNRGTVMLTLLAMPLYIPVLIFSGSALSLCAAGLDMSAPVALLWAVVALAGPVAPILAAAMLAFARG